MELALLDNMPSGTAYTQAILSFARGMYVLARR